MRRHVFTWAAAVLLSSAQMGLAERCRLALSLAMDVSSSVDEREYGLQRIGLAQALNAPEIRHAILSGGAGYVALSVYEWSGANQQQLQLDWYALRTPSDIDQAVVTLGGMTRSHDDFPTSIGPALAYGAALMGRAPNCERRVIDMSGDGVHNFRYGPREAYRHFALGNVTVNGLAILGEDPAVVGYYNQEIIQGPGAFVIVAQGFDDFQAAMTRKLYREVNDIVLGQAPLSAPSPHPGGG